MSSRFLIGASIRIILFLSSKAINLPPTLTQEASTTSPALTIAILEVPPPISIFMTVFFDSFEYRAAPEPIAAITDSKLGPAAAQTNFPAL